MWPSVYVLDRQGYIREFWPGELQWEGATGDKYLQQQIEKLMKEWCQFQFLKSTFMDFSLSKSHSSVSSRSNASSASSVMMSSPSWLSINCMWSSISRMKTAQQRLACCCAESGAPSRKQQVFLRDSYKIRRNRMKSSWNDLTIQNTKRHVFRWEVVLRGRIIQKANERKWS